MNPVRDAILQRLTTGKPEPAPALPPMPDLPHLAMNPDELLDTLVKHLTEQGAEVHRAQSFEELPDLLAALIRDNHFTRILASQDPFMAGLTETFSRSMPDLALFRPDDFPERSPYKETAFTVDAGLTSVDFAVAESGTLAIAHNRTNPRLPSLSPLVHLAVVRKSTVVPVYDTVLKRLMDSGGLPSQLTFITGPSMTADIMATPFRGMHGPKRLLVVVVHD